MARAQGPEEARAPQAPLATLADLPDGEARGIEASGPEGRVRLILVRRGDAVYAYVNRCPHVGTPLDWAPDEFLDRERRHLVCATHGALFRIEDGHCIAGPCQGDALEPWPIELRDGAVWSRAARRFR